MTQLITSFIYVNSSVNGNKVWVRLCSVAQFSAGLGQMSNFDCKKNMQDMIFRH